jgi:APA family basic amino acid/polyamine antiporter
VDLFQTKPLDRILAESESNNALKRSLGPGALVALGVGAVIGAGIFTLTGVAASANSGPGLIFSFVLAAIGCSLAGLCYSEFATMIPVAGSAYTYAYASFGELWAWIIGWDLILEYAVGAADAGRPAG